MSLDGDFVSWRSLPVLTSTFQMSALPERGEKNAIHSASGDQLECKSPPGPFVNCREEPFSSESSQMFISPERSELKAIHFPSRDQAPRLSSRLEAMTFSGSPVRCPVSGATGSFQMSAFCLRIAKASFWPSRVNAASMSWPAPEVTCCGRPDVVPSAFIAERQRFKPPVRSDEK